jgi:prophage antirepressor-like protein
MKDTELITFENQDIGEIRGFMKDGEPWFLAGQVCRCLRIKDSNRAVANIRNHYKNAGIEGKHDNTTPLITPGGTQQVLCIDEQFLYELIFSSKKKEAIRFKAWVTGEVLPSIRKTGQYRMAGKLIRRSLTDEIKISGENERMHGHGYSTYTKIINKSLGLPPKNNRDELPSEVLEKVAMRENTVQALMREGKQYNEIKEVIEKLSDKSLSSPSGI